MGHADGRSFLHEETVRCTSETICKFFTLCPNVRRVDLEFETRKQLFHLDDDPLDFMSQNQFTLSCIHDGLLALRNQLEKSRLHLGTYDDSYLPFEMIEKTTQIEMNGFQEFSLDWADISHTFTSNPFLAFKNLTRIECRFQDNPSISVSPSCVLQLLLKTIPGLRSLAFTVGQLPLSRECFEALITSRLTYLNIGNEVIADFEKSSIAETLQPNRLLQHFSIDAKSHDLRLLFASYLPSLEHLIFSEVDEGTLHNIFRYQNNLRSLRVYNRRSNYRGQNNIFRDYNMYLKFLQNDDLLQNRQLSCLTHLFIEEQKINLTKFLLSEFKFPQLKSLTICITHDRFKDEFWKILSTMTQIKFLKVDFRFRTKISFQQLSLLVQLLPNLRHIHININTLPECFDPSEYRQLFNKSSSLRTVIHNSVKYSYDATDHTIRNVPNPDNHFFVDPLQDFGLPMDRFHRWTCEGIPHHYAYDNACWQ